MRIHPFPVFAIAIAVFASSAAAEVPSFLDIAGYEQGESVTSHATLIRYLDAVDRASDRVRVIEQGASWEGRSLPLAIITSPENHARLDQIKAVANRLGDARRTSESEAIRLMENQPSIVWLGGSIHGFEVSGSEGLIRLIEHLASRNDPETRQVLENTVILIDPMLNPDGRDIFASRIHENLGRKPNPDRADWSNDFTRWEGLKFRTGHYYFDTNRDWWAQTQRETKSRAWTMVEWRPQVVIDAHEMGSDSEFYFDPPAEPYGPYFPEFARKWFVRFGEEHARAFDAAGFEYMTRERYNYFYPGYTTSYGSYQGAVGMLYEQGSSRGLAITRPDGSVRTLEHALEQQYVAAWAAVRLAARERSAILSDYWNAQKKAIVADSKTTRRYLITPEGDAGLIYKFTDTMLKNGIELHVLDEPVRLDRVRDRAGATLGSKTFPAGTIVVETEQPRSALIRVLLEPDLPLPAEFLDDARRKLDRGENPRFYDITAWSLPLMFNLDGYSTTDARPLPATLNTPDEKPEGEDEKPADAPRGRPHRVETPIPDARYAWALNGRSASSMIGLVKMREMGHRASVLLHGTKTGGTEIPGGSIIFRIGQNDEDLREHLTEIASDSDLDVIPIQSGLSPAGLPALGSGDDVIAVKDARIALVAEGPVHAYSFGWAWFVLDRQYEVPLTVLRAGSIGSTPLDDYDVIVLPHLLSAEEMVRTLGESGITRIKSWIQDGGTLVALGGAVDFVRKNLELTALRDWYEVEAEKSRKGNEEKGKEPRRFDVPGAILRVDFDHRHWMTAGYESALPALVTSDRIYVEPEGPPDSGRRVIARYADRGSVRLSGHVWPETLERLPGSVFAYEERVGRGRVIAFAEDLNFRGFWRGADRLFLNAVLLGPSAP